MRPRLLAALALALLLLACAACGKKGSPSAPGPQEEIISGRTYPAL